MQMKRILIVVGLVLALGGCSADQSAEGPAAASAPAGGAAAAAPEGSVSPAGAGVNQESRAFIDPVTGEMRAPTAAELAASKPPASTEQASRQERPPPVETRLPDGTIMIDMRNQPQVEEQACVQADGSLGACPAR
jgi:hypothetical protein